MYWPSSAQLDILRYLHVHLEIHFIPFIDNRSVTGTMARCGCLQIRSGHMLQFEVGTTLVPSLQQHDSMLKSAYMQQLSGESQYRHHIQKGALKMLLFEQLQLPTNTIFASHRTD